MKVGWEGKQTTTSIPHSRGVQPAWPLLSTLPPRFFFTRAAFIKAALPCALQNSTGAYIFLKSCLFEREKNHGSQDSSQATLPLPTALGAVCLFQTYCSAHYILYCRAVGLHPTTSLNQIIGVAASSELNSHCSMLADNTCCTCAMCVVHWYSYNVQGTGQCQANIPFTWLCVPLHPMQLQRQPTASHLIISSWKRLNLSTLLLKYLFMLYE